MPLQVILIRGASRLYKVQNLNKPIKIYGNKRQSTVQDLPRLSNNRKVATPFNDELIKA